MVSSPRICPLSDPSKAMVSPAQIRQISDAENMIEDPHEAYINTYKTRPARPFRSQQLQHTILSLDNQKSKQHIKHDTWIK